MQKNNYHAYLEHKEKHDNMFQEISNMIISIGNDDNVNIKSITNYLIEWFKEHFTSYDKEMGEYLNSLDKSYGRI